MERAYSTVVITKAAAAERTVEGIASVPSVDRQGDILEPKGFRWRKLADGRPDVPWLMQHRHSEPIGHVEWLQARADGLRFRARMPRIDGPPALKERLDTAYAEIASGLVRGISVGFMPLKAEPIETGWRFKEVSLYEISSVTIPACEEACVEVVKRYAEAARSAEVPSLTGAGSLWEQVSGVGRTAYDRVKAKAEKATPSMRVGLIAHETGRDMIRALCGHIEQLERRLTEAPLKYVGVWRSDRTYPPNSFCTHNGAVWFAEKATDFKPGEGHGWVLAVKAGRDGRDIRP